MVHQPAREVDRHHRRFRFFDALIIVVMFAEVLIGAKTFFGYKCYEEAFVTTQGMAQLYCRDSWTDGRLCLASDSVRLFDKAEPLLSPGDWKTRTLQRCIELGARARKAYQLKAGIRLFALLLVFGVGIGLIVVCSRRGAQKAKRWVLVVLPLLGLPLLRPGTENVHSGALGWWLPLSQIGELSQTWLRGEDKKEPAGETPSVQQPVTPVAPVAPVTPVTPTPVVTPTPSPTPSNKLEDDKEQCAVCHGSGRCTKCGGRGYYQIEDIYNGGYVDQPCTICGQSGACPTCHGKGWYWK